MPQYIPQILPNGLVKNVSVYNTGRGNYMIQKKAISEMSIDGYFVPDSPDDARMLRDWVPFNDLRTKEITMPAVSTKPKSTSSKPITTYSNPNEIRVKAPKPKPVTYYEQVQELNANPTYIEFPDGSTLRFRFTSLTDVNRGVVETSVDGRAIDIRGYLTDKGFEPDADRMKDYRLLYKKKSENRISA